MRFVAVNRRLGGLPCWCAQDNKEINLCVYRESNPAIQHVAYSNDLLSKINYFKKPHSYV
jgi:hypothetical protein